MAGKRILIVSTSFDKLGTSDEPTGLWIEELAAPYFIFKEAGAHVDVASIKGGRVPIGYKFDHFLTSYMITHPSHFQAAIPTMFYQLIKSSVNVCFSCCCFA
jgi:putative intracellular protease/amidase